jgi:hypothetical protein
LKPYNRLEPVYSGTVIVEHRGSIFAVHLVRFNSQELVRERMRRHGSKPPSAPPIGLSDSVLVSPDAGTGQRHSHDLAMKLRDCETSYVSAEVTSDLLPKNESFCFSDLPGHFFSKQVLELCLGEMESRRGRG